MRWKSERLSLLQLTKKGALEINTGGVARGYRTDFYPAPDLLAHWRALGGKVILTADAHSTENLLFAFEQAADYARQAGFDRVWVLNACGALEECCVSNK